MVTLDELSERHQNDKFTETLHLQYIYSYMGTNSILVVLMANIKKKTKGITAAEWMQNAKAKTYMCLRKNTQFFLFINLCVADLL